MCIPASKFHSPFDIVIINDYILITKCTLSVLYTYYLLIPGIPKNASVFEKKSYKGPVSLLRTQFNSVSKTSYIDHQWYVVWLIFYLTQHKCEQDSDNSALDSVTRMLSAEDIVV